LLLLQLQTTIFCLRQPLILWHWRLKILMCKCIHGLAPQNSYHVYVPESQLNSCKHPLAEYTWNEVDNRQGLTWNDRAEIFGSGRMRDDTDEEIRFGTEFSLSRFDVEFIE
jgi:hypothetical protein